MDEAKPFRALRSLAQSSFSLSLSLFYSLTTASKPASSSLMRLLAGGYMPPRAVAAACERGGTF